MTQQWTTHTSATDARKAAEELLASGAPSDHVRVLTGRAPADVRREPAGGFAGPIGPDAPVGTYGGTTVQRRQGAGTFAGDAAAQRQGSFADTDRVTITGYRNGDTVTRVTGLRGARRLLSRAGLDDSSLAAVVADLHRGLSVLVVDAGGGVSELSDAADDSRVRRAA
jgi:hypothetical protein